MIVIVLVFGIIGCVVKLEGNLISIGVDSLFILIYQSNLIWVSFSLGDSDLVKLLNGCVISKNVSGVELIQGNGMVYLKIGKLNFFVSNIDMMFGIQWLWVEFDNSVNQLLFGQFVWVCLLIGMCEGVFLVL